jgi:hypothetical protein
VRISDEKELGIIPAAPHADAGDGEEPSQRLLQGNFVEKQGDKKLHQDAGKVKLGSL